MVGCTEIGGSWGGAEMGDDGIDCGVDVTGVGFIVRTLGVTDKGGTHG